MAFGPSIPHLQHVTIGKPITRLGVSFFPIDYPASSLPEISTGSSSGLVVEELGSAEVPTLSVYNPTNTPVLIVEGEHFLGGKQNRSVNTTVLVSGKTKLNIPVTCLEQGRWGRPREYTRAPSFTPVRIRALNQEAVDANRRAYNSHEGDQGQVWNAVHEFLSDAGLASPTSAAADADRGAERDASWRSAVEELSALGPLPRQCGFAVAREKRIGAIELFGARKLLKAHWSSLVRSYMLEPPLLGDRPSRKAVRSALKKLGSLTAETSPGIGLGIEHRVRDRSVVGHALVLSESVVHCSAFWRKRKQGYKRGIPQTRTVHGLREAMAM